MPRSSQKRVQKPRARAGSSASAAPERPARRAMGPKRGDQVRQRLLGIDPVEAGQHVGQRGAAQADLLAPGLLGVGSAAGEGRERLVGAGAHVARGDVEEAGQIEEALAAEAIDLGGGRARGAKARIVGGVGDVGEEEEGDERDPEERGEGPEEAAQRVGQHGPWLSGGAG